MAFVGVEFNETDGGGVELVHSNWCTPRKKEVFWPPFKTIGQFEAALKKGTAPDENTWRLYSIKRTFFTADNFDKANKTLTKYQINSDITDSDAEPSAKKQCLPKRHCQPPRRLSYGSSDDELQGTLSQCNEQSRQPPPIKATPSNNSNASSLSLPTTVTFHPDSGNSSYQLSTPTSNNYNYRPSEDAFQKKIISLLLLIKEQNAEILGWINKQNVSTLPFELPKDAPVNFPISKLADVYLFHDYLKEKNYLSAIVCAEI